MKLEHYVHPIESMRSGAATALDGRALFVQPDALIAHLLEDRRLARVDVQIAGPDEPCRIGAVFDILAPRAKHPGNGANFPGILDPMAVAGSGITHVLAGAAITVLDPLTETAAGAKLLELGGAAADHTPYGRLWHLVVTPVARRDVPDHAARHAFRLASVKTAVYLARATVAQPPARVETLAVGRPGANDRPGVPRVAFIGQILAHHRYIESDEPILYGSSTHGMVPTILHPNEWLDGAVVCSYRNLQVETYFYQNHPVIRELIRRHDAGELDFVGTVATTSESSESARDRNCALAAHLARDILGADGVVLTSYGGGAPHADMGQTASLCEGLGMRTVVLVAEMAGDRRAESANIFSYPEVDAAVCIGGGDTSWEALSVERVLGSSPGVAAGLETLAAVDARSLCGATNQQGASRVRSMIW
ncbi:MAG: hypothetical protein O3B84_03215 [Chloroflexi bacterium]|nr:hypothetical protein [Chloroflexota bacterium]